SREFDSGFQECGLPTPPANVEDIDHMNDTGSPKSNKLLGKYFFYDPPLSEETGVWIPVSVPPMSETQHQEWTRGFSSVGGIFPDEDTGWNHFLDKDKEITMWDVVVEMLLAARGKLNCSTSGDNVAWISRHLIDQAWKEMAQTLTDANFGNIQELLETEPPKWLPDSSAASCMLCNVRFHPIMCTRHHCRFCGGIFCSECSKGRSLLPAKFRASDTERVCDVCFVRLEAVQPYLRDHVSRASQLPTHDLTDLSTLRSWLNFPWGQSMEHEIYKATNIIQGYSKVGSLRPEKSIPEAILRHAKGLAVLTIVKVGMMVTYKIGTGLVIARREDGSWSPPSAISSIGVGWEEAVKIFSSDAHVSFGAGLGGAIGIFGRTAEADVRAGTGGYAACYTYSCTKGAFVGCSLEGSVVTTRTHENSRFYGKQYINAPEILLGSLARPPAAATLYRALADIYQKL
nr:Ysc84 actin-binding domain-containing protein [Tanacetum cinerariifolium]